MARRSGVERIAAERQRQIEEEGWSPQHDNQHDQGELALAAVCYASPKLVYVVNGNHGLVFEDPWPWIGRVKRPTDTEGKLLPNSQVSLPERIRQLEKAGALIAAEIDRLQRLGERSRRKKKAKR